MKSKQSGNGSSVQQQHYKIRERPRGRPFPKGEMSGKPFPKGVSGNPGGKPKLLKDAYREWLTQINDKDPNFRTNAECIAETMGNKALRGDVVVARELRSATEGDRITVVWQSEFVQLLQQGVITAQEVIEALGPEEARAILIAAGGGMMLESGEIKEVESVQEELEQPK